MNETEMQMDMLSQILQELQTLNVNFDSYVSYTKEQDSLSVEEKLQEKEQSAAEKAEEMEKMEAEKAQKEAEEANAETTLNPYDEKLSSIETILVRVDDSLQKISVKESTDYAKNWETLQESQDNIEYNTSYFVLLGFVIIACIAVLIGFKLGGKFLRKI